MNYHVSNKIKDQNQNQISQDSLFKILSFLCDLKELEKNNEGRLGQIIGWKNLKHKDKVNQIKKQITELLNLSIEEKDHSFDKYIDDENYKLHLDILIVNGKITENTITDIDKIYEHPSASCSDYLFLSFVEGNCLDDLINSTFQIEDDVSETNKFFYIRGERYKFEQVKQFKKIFSNEALAKTKYIFGFDEQKENSAVKNVNTIKELISVLRAQSIRNSHNFVLWFKEKFPGQKMSWSIYHKDENKNFRFLDKFDINSILDWDELAEIINFSEERKTETETNKENLNQLLFDEKIVWYWDDWQKLKSDSIKKAETLLARIRKIDITNAGYAYRNCFANCSFCNYDLNNSNVCHKLKIKFTPTKLYIILSALSCILFLPLGIYFICQTYKSYKNNIKYDWIKERRQKPKKYLPKIIDNKENTISETKINTSGENINLEPEETMAIQK